MYYIRTLSQKTGIAPETIRYYERIGILPPAQRAPNGYRIYSETDVERLYFISGARRLGLSLDAIGRILTHKDNGQPPCTQVQILLDQQIDAVERQIQQLVNLRDDLHQLRAMGATLPDDVNMRKCICGLIANPIADEG